MRDEERADTRTREMSRLYFGNFLTFALVHCYIPAAKQLLTDRAVRHADYSFHRQPSQHSSNQECPASLVRRSGRTISLALNFLWDG